LATLVRPSGYFRQKAHKLKAFISFLIQEFDGSLDRMFETPTAELRERLLQVFGIGPETADSILLYAGRHLVFVVDAYARRILMRHGWLAAGADYRDVQSLFESRLEPDSRVFNEFHALIVNVGKNWCRRNSTRCEECPLGVFREARQ
jgi:endonuclease III related protein